MNDQYLTGYEKGNIKKLGHPLFVTSIVLLFLNDWWLKGSAENLVTGKLSDFAGLFAFPFFVSAIFPKRKRMIHWLTVCFFIFWKSAFSQPLLDIANGVGVPIHRVVDFTDHIALVSVYFSYLIFNNDFNWKLARRPWIVALLMIFSVFNFVATSMVPRANRTYVNVDKTYSFNISKRELISRLNMIQVKEVDFLNKIGGRIDFDSETGVFRYQEQTDTVAVLLDPKKVSDQDVIKLKTSLADIQLSGTDSTSTLKLLTVTKVVKRPKMDKDYRDAAIKAFEKRIVTKIKNYGQPMYRDKTKVVRSAD